MSDQPTPNRHTSFVLDSGENVLTCPFFGVRRRGPDIAPSILSGGQADPARMQGLKLWSSGAVTMAPVQTEISNIREQAVYYNRLVVPDKLTLVEYMVAIRALAVENTYYDNSDLPGLPASDPTKITSGGPYLVKNIAAGDTYDQQVASGQPSLLSGTDPNGELLDRVGESVNSFPADQAWFLSWDVPGHRLDYHPYTLAFYFGQYGVAFSGSGYASLYANLVQSDYTTSWVQVDSWRYAKTAQNSDTSFAMGIFPHLGPRGEQLISFTNGAVDFAQRIPGSGQQGAAAPGDHVHTVKPIRGYTNVAPLGHVTTSNIFRFDERRGLNLRLQVSTLGFAATGFVVDDPINLPPSNPHSPLYAYAEKTTPPGTGLVCSLLGKDTGAAFDPATDQAAVARFDFTSDGNNTAILWGYGARRDPLSTYVAPGAFTGGNLRSVSVAGYSGDPTQQSATLTIEDPDGQLAPRALNRGQFPVTIQVSHQSADGSGGTRLFHTPLFRGYVNAPVARKTSGSDAPAWFHYTMPALGMWMRLAEPVQSAVLQQQFFAETDAGGNLTGPLDANGSPTALPWKVTDAIRYLLLCCGFVPEQINIPDIDFRLWFGIGSDGNELNVSPHTDFAEMALGFCRNYLGMYLCYDESADYWTLLPGTPLDAKPLYHFVTAPSGGSVSQTAAGSYPPLTTFVTDLELTTLPPEFNVVHVSTGAPVSGSNFQHTIETYLYNFQSAPVYGATSIPNPDFPDFLGRVREVEIIDPSLVVIAGPNTAQATQAAVDWTARRVYNFCCHAQRLAHFRAPLALIVDPITNLYRPLRFGDPITLDGAAYQVKGVRINYSLGNQQMATYECIQPAAGQYVPPGMTALSFRRGARSKMTRKGMGASTQSLRLGSLAPVPHAESRHRNLPVNTDYQVPLQDGATGQFYFMMGMDALGSAPLA